MSDTPAPIPASTLRRRAWTAPVIYDLPRLTDLTLQTGPPSTMTEPRQPGVFRLGGTGVPT
jgi:hypothetical protein